MTPRHFLSDQSPLQTEDAAAAIIVVGNGGYLLQLRDDIPGIFYPGHWSCFGGAIHAGETGREALRRELAEELELTVAQCEEFIRIDFDLLGVNGKKIYRTYYEIQVTAGEASHFVLHEGADAKVLQAADLFDGRPVAPYDAFALWLHVARARMR
jgi:8-oxo-dGTP pyrophosphatase MutT (NUDIX family)